MPMQISLDEVLSMLISRVDSLSMANENMKSHANIVARALYKKGFLTDEDIIASIKDENQLMQRLGALKELPDEESVKTVADSILQWIKCDDAGIKKSLQDYKEKMEAMIKEEQSKPRLDVASAADLQRLNRMSGKSGSKLLIP